MVYLIAVIMGYLAGINGAVERQAAHLPGTGYSHPALSALSKLGAIGMFPCILPAAYFVGADYGNGFMEGLYFFLAAIGGALISGVLAHPVLSWWLSPLTVFINVGLAVYVYSIT